MHLSIHLSIYLSIYPSSIHSFRMCSEDSRRCRSPPLVNAIYIQNRLSKSLLLLHLGHHLPDHEMKRVWSRFSDHFHNNGGHFLFFWDHVNALSHEPLSRMGEGGKGVTSAWSPLGNFSEGQAHPNLSSNQVLLFFLTWSFLCLLSGGFSLRLLFSNSFQFKFFIYSLYIHIYIFYIFFHCTCGALQCSHGLWSLCRASSRWQTRSPAVGALWVYS